MIDFNDLYNVEIKLFIQGLLEVLEDDLFLAGVGEIQQKGFGGLCSCLPAADFQFVLVLDDLPLRE